MLILLGGPDRVGKSTLAETISTHLNFSIRHHSEPNPGSASIFDNYLTEAREGINQIWDRSYLCAFILERQRKRTHDHLTEILDLELEISKLHDVIHVGVTRPWNWVAPLHVEEIEKEFKDSQSWYQRDMLMARQEEHHFYTSEMDSFYRYVTMFPSFMVEPTWTELDVVENIRAISKSERPRFITT